MNSTRLMRKMTEMKEKTGKRGKKGKKEKKEMNRTSFNDGITVLYESERDGCFYSLLKIEYARAVVYGIYAEDREQFAVALIGDEENNAKQNFFEAAEGSLSPRHLAEWAEDLRAKIFE